MCTLQSSQNPARIQDFFRGGGGGGGGGGGPGLMARKQSGQRFFVVFLVLNLLTYFSVYRGGPMDIHTKNCEQQWFACMIKIK